MRLNGSASIITRLGPVPLNGARLLVGDRLDYIELDLLNRASLLDSHPLKTTGLNTSGYQCFFVAKQDLTLSDTATGVIRVKLVPTSADKATLSILPADTSAIAFGTANELLYYWDIQIAEASGNYVYTVVSGVFILVRGVKL